MKNVLAHASHSINVSYCPYCHLAWDLQSCWQNQSHWISCLGVFKKQKSLELINVAWEYQSVLLILVKVPGNFTLIGISCLLIVSSAQSGTCECVCVCICVLTCVPICDCMCVLLDKPKPSHKASTTVPHTLSPSTIPVLRQAIST